MFTAAPKLDDCHLHGLGSGAELYLVEGDSAAGAVSRVRDPRLQAVLPMMGKPMNAAKASPARVAAYPLFQTLVAAVGAGDGPTFDVQKSRYDRVVLLMDADADGIHCAALMCLYFYRRMWPLLSERRVSVAHAPMASITSPTLERTVYAFNDAEYQATARDLRAAGHDLQIVRYRGLAGLDLATLSATCVHPATRVLHPLGRVDADAMQRVIGKGQPQPTLF